MAYAYCHKLIVHSVGLVVGKGHFIGEAVVTQVVVILQQYALLLLLHAELALLHTD